MNTTTKSDQETKDMGKKLAASLNGGDIVCLRGELGAGKTTFVKGLAEGLGVADEIKSPTFTLMNIYKIKNTKHRTSNTHFPIDQLVHIDTYRLKNEQELIDIGVEDYLGQPGVLTVVEWPEKLLTLLENKKMTEVAIGHLEENTRKIEIS